MILSCKQHLSRILYFEGFMKFNMLNILTLSVVFLYATAFAGDADRVNAPKKRAAFNAAAFLAPAPVPVKVEAEKPAPKKRAAFNAAAFLAPASVPVKVEAEKPAPRKRAAFNASAFLPASALFPLGEKVGPFKVVQALNPQAVVLDIPPPPVGLDNSAGVEDYMGKMLRLDGVGVGEPGGMLNAFEKRLKEYFVGHWVTYYKPEAQIFNAPQMDRMNQAIQRKFDQINAQLVPVLEKRRRKILLVENITHHFFDTAPTNVDAVIAEIAAAIPDNSIYTNMQKIRELPFVDWDEALNKYVFSSNPILRRGQLESDKEYWVRIGQIILKIYETRIKPHIFPDNLALLLRPLGDARPADLESTLLGLRDMFSDLGDAYFALAEYENEIFELKLTPAGLERASARIIQGTLGTYQKINAAMYQGLSELFGIPNPNIAAAAAFCWYGYDLFDAERQALCKKVLFIFTYFSRPGGSYQADYSDYASLVGRFTHCNDGKKDAINNVSSRALVSLVGNDNAGPGVGYDFNTFIKKWLLSNLKNESINKVCNHPEYRENVSLSLEIRFLNKDFWENQSERAGMGGKLNASDYAFTRGEKGIPLEQINSVLQAFYQHVYVSPQELVNVIYNKLKTSDRKLRADFFGRASEMLINLPQFPFQQWMIAGIDVDKFIQQGYCTDNCLAAQLKHAEDALKAVQHLGEAQVVAAVQSVGEARQRIADARRAAGLDLGRADRDAKNPDYMFTRKGIEALLFYSGYLAWSGSKVTHPLVVNWRQAAKWLKEDDVENFNDIYYP